jgi:hypothetical protein
LKRFTPFIGFTGMALGFFPLFIAQNLLTAAIGCIFLGAMYGGGMTYYLMYCTVIVPPTQITISVSITTFILSAAGFLSTYLSLLLQWVLNVSITGIIPPLCVVLVLGAVLSVIAALKDRRATMVD